MFKQTFPGIETWQLTPKVYINYVRPDKDIPITSQIHEETIIIVDNAPFTFNGDLREELLQTGGDLLKLKEWYNNNVLLDINCHQPYVANSLKEIFNKKIRNLIPRKRK